jgi:hypothetical protein
MELLGPKKCTTHRLIPNRVGAAKGHDGIAEAPSAAEALLASPVWAPIADSESGRMS